MTGAAEAAKAALTVAAPEVAIPAQLVGELLTRRNKPTRTETATVGGEVVVIPPEEHPPFLKLRKDKVRVVVKKGVRIVTVERGAGVSVGEVILLGLAAGGTLTAYEAYKYLKGSGTSKNAIGIPFGSHFPGGGWNPANYLVP